MSLLSLDWKPSTSPYQIVQIGPVTESVPSFGGGKGSLIPYLKFSQKC